MMILLWTGLCAALIGLDRITKLMAIENIKPLGSMTVIDGVLDFTFVENRGAAFGILQGRQWFFVALTCFVGAVMAYYLVKLPKKPKYRPLRFALTLILAGALGNNLIDRITYGYVVDFLEATFISWPVFNIADIYIVTGTILLVILMLFVYKDELGA